MKYLILRTKLGDLVQKVPIIFPKFLVHAHVAKYLTGLLIREYGRDREITVANAGEISITECACFGESETTKTKSAGCEDSNLISYYDYFNGLDSEIEIPEYKKEDPELEKDILSAKLHQAWSAYVKGFGEPPHGTMKQLRALLEFMPK